MSAHPSHGFYKAYRNEEAPWYWKYHDRVRSRLQVLLVLTGALNPVHNGHLHMLEYARKQLLESTSYKEANIRAILSPSHDNYVKNKLGALPIQQRLEMVQLVVSDSKYSWVEAGEWEGSNTPTEDTYHDFPEVVEHYQSQHKGVRVVYVAGQDHYENHIKNNKELDVIWVPRNMVTDLSSSKVRSMSNYQEIEQAVPEAVAKYIFEHRLYASRQDALVVASYNVAGNVQSLIEDSNNSENVTVQRMKKENAPANGEYAALFMKKLGVDLLGVQEMLYDNTEKFRQFLGEDDYGGYCQEWKTKKNGSACFWYKPKFSEATPINILEENVDPHMKPKQVRSASAVYFPGHKILFLNAWLDHNKERKKKEALQSLGAALENPPKENEIDRIILAMDANDDDGTELEKEEIKILGKTLSLRGQLCHSCCEDENFIWRSDFIFDSCSPSQVLSYGIPDLPSRSELDKNFPLETTKWTPKTQLMSDHLPILMVSKIHPITSSKEIVKDISLELKATDDAGHIPSDSSKTETSKKRNYYLWADFHTYGGDELNSGDRKKMNEMVDFISKKKDSIKHENTKVFIEKGVLQRKPIAGGFESFGIVSIEAFRKTDLQKFDFIDVDIRNYNTNINNPSQWLYRDPDGKTQQDLNLLRKPILEFLNITKNSKLQTFNIEQLFQQTNIWSWILTQKPWPGGFLFNNALTTLNKTFEKLGPTLMNDKLSITRRKALIERTIQVIELKVPQEKAWPWHSFQNLKIEQGTDKITRGFLFNTIGAVMDLYTAALIEVLSPKIENIIYLSGGFHTDALIYILGLSQKDDCTIFGTALH